MSPLIWQSTVGEAFCRRHLTVGALWRRLSYNYAEAQTADQVCLLGRSCMHADEYQTYKDQYTGCAQKFAAKIRYSQCQNRANRRDEHAKDANSSDDDQI
jgi:hypothetical protein